MNKKILYVYTSGRKERIYALKTGEAPNEMLYGFPYFKKRGYITDFIEAGTLRPDCRGINYKLLNIQNYLFRKSLKIGMNSRIFLGILDKLNHHDMIIAIPDSMALGLAYFRNKKKLKTPIVYIEMGLASRLYNLKKRNKILYAITKNYCKNLIKNCRKIIFLGKGEYDFFLNEFDDIKEKFYFLPFGVDTDFWVPVEGQSNDESFILFVGNDSNRDFELVVKIAEELKQVKFRFVTSRIKKQEVPKNVELIRGDWRTANISDVEMRKIYQDSALVILPLKNSLQPSGQSVALQAMACGKPVLITKTRGFWDTENFINRKHIFFIVSNEVEKWVDIIKNILEDKKLCDTLSAEGQKLVREKFSTKIFAEKLEKVIFGKNGEYTKR